MADMICHKVYELLMSILKSCYISQKVTGDKSRSTAGLFWKPCMAYRKSLFRKFFLRTFQNIYTSQFSCPC
jgi:hypothetical protein